MNKIVMSTVLLGVFALIGTGLVAYTFQSTKEQIKRNELADQLRRLNEILPKDAYDNKLVADKQRIGADPLLGTSEPTFIYRARKQGQPVAVFFTVIAPDGYNGNIKLLVGVRHDGTLAGVRHITHKETPGLGDKIDIRKSNWIKSFDGKSLKQGDSDWRVKKDGGVFDQFTGATITPRAVVKAVHRTLEYYAVHKDELFKPVHSKKSKPASEAK